MTALLDIAKRLLSQREHSAYMLFEKLKQRGFGEVEIDDTLKQCEQAGYLSDARFADALCRARLNKGYGPVVIQQLLRQARVSSDIIASALNTLDETVSWFDEAKRVREKKFRSKPDIPELKQKQFLKYRGFTDTVIREIFT